MTDKPRVLVDIQDNVAIVTMNRAEKYNGIDYPMFMGLIDAAKRIKKDKSLRAVILRGDGPAFSSGLDILSVKKDPLMLPKLFLKPGRKMTNKAQDVSYLWRRLPIPVIAVTHGQCFGGALHVAMGADFRFSTPECQFSIMEAKWGLIPDMGGMLAWREVLRGDVLRELSYTGRIISAEEALDVGLITRIEPDPMAAAFELIEELNTRSPDSVGATKLLINRIWAEDIRGVLHWETKFQKKVMGRWNHIAAASRNVRDKPLKYKNRRIN